MNGNKTWVVMNRMFIVQLMNGWLGKPLNDSLEEIFSDKERMEINESSEIYKELLNKTSYAYA